MSIDRIDRIDRIDKIDRIDNLIKEFLRLNVNEKIQFLARLELEGLEGLEGLEEKELHKKVCSSFLQHKTQSCSSLLPFGYRVVVEPLPFKSHFRSSK